MMRRRPVLVMGIALLVIANLWRWLGADEMPRGTRLTEAHSALRPEDYDLARLLIGEQRPKELRRNLFAPKQARPVAVRPPAAVKPAAPAEPPPPDPEALALQAAEADLAQIRVVGIVLREGQGQAYLVKGDEVYLVSAGQRAAGRYRVERVTADAVELRDTQTPAARRVALSGD